MNCTMKSIGLDSENIINNYVDNMKLCEKCNGEYFCTILNTKDKGVFCKECLMKKYKASIEEFKQIIERNLEEAKRLREMLLLPEYSTHSDGLYLLSLLHKISISNEKKVKQIEARKTRMNFHKGFSYINCELEIWWM